MEDYVVELFVPITMFISIAAPVCLYFYFRYRHRGEIQKTIRAAVEHGQPLTPEVLERLAQTYPSRIADLRRGVISIALGVGSVVFGLLIEDADLRQGMLLVAVFPVVVGIAYLGLWRFAPRE